MLMLARVLCDDSTGEDGKLDEATPFVKQALEIRKKALGKDHPKVGFSLNSLAALLKEQGKTLEAETIARQAVDLQKKVLGDEHKLTLNSTGNLGTILMDKDDKASREEGRAIVQSILAKLSDILGLAPTHPWIKKFSKALSAGEAAVAAAAEGGTKTASAVRPCELAKKRSFKQSVLLRSISSWIILAKNHSGKRRRAECVEISV